jgi:1-acyl-sn-glycerol-3-phosphate acyltransferase
LDRVGKTIASYLLWVLILIGSPILWVGAFVIWLVTLPFDRRLRILHLYSCWWASIYTYIFPYWSVSVRNRERLRSDRAFVVVSNHQSLLDILVLFRLYRHFKWVSKAVIFRLPFIGWNMSMNRYIAIRRGDPKDAVRMMNACGDALESGSSILIFPEGTRSLDGELRDFRHGAFTLALRHKVAILPIVLDGTLDALPKHGIVSPGADIVIQVLDPIPVDGFADVDTLRDHVRGVMAAELLRLRAERRHGSLPPRAPAVTTARSA